MSYNFNMATWGDLNCMRECKFPVSYSLQSVTMKPPAKDAGGLVSLTLRLPGEIRVVHGNDDFHGTVKKYVTGAHESANPDTAKEKNGAWTWNVSGCDFKDRQGVVVSVKLLEGIVKGGWEVISSADFTTTPGFELVTWVFKKSSTPLGADNGEVAAVFLSPPNYIEVVGVTEGNKLDDVLQEALGGKYLSAREEKKEVVVADTEKAEPIKEKIVDDVEAPKEEKKKEEEEGEKKEDDKNEDEKKEPAAAIEEKPKQEGDAKPAAKKEAAEEPEKPSITFPTLNIDMNHLNSETSNAFRSKLVLELIHVLFSRQWKLIATAHLPCAGSKHEAMFFCKDSRILPGLGGEGAFSMVEIEKPDLVRLYNLSEDAEREVKLAMQENWIPGMESKEPEIVEETVRQFKLLENPWVGTGRILDNGVKIPSVSPQGVVSAFMLGLNKCELNLYARVTLGKQQKDQRTLFIFRQSNVSYSEYLTIKLTGLNRLAILGGTDDDLMVIRNCLQSRWPYPLSRDYRVMSDVGQPDWWFFKVKRYPWTVSYGNKHVDKAIEATKTLLEKQNVNVPGPSNMDAESAKSLLIFLLKDLGEHGWRLQTMADVSSDFCCKGSRQPLPERPSDPHSIFLLK